MKLLERKIEQLKTSERKLLKELKLWETKLKKANNLANCLTAANKFANQFLTAKIDNERDQEQPDNKWLECLISQQVEFNLKFAAGIEVFGKLIRESVEREVRFLQIGLEATQSQLCHQERKFIRLQARRQGKILLNCEYRKSLGCLGNYQCNNCQVNYPAIEANQLNEVKVLLRSKRFLKEVLAKMGAEVLKFSGFFEKDQYLKDFQCPRCRQYISERDIEQKNYMLWVSDYANELTKEQSLGSTHYGLSFWLRLVEHQECPETETCEKCGELLLLTNLKEFNGNYYCIPCIAEVRHE